MKPLSDGRFPYKKEALREVPEKIARFYQVNDVNRFQLDRPVHKSPVDKENEFKVSSCFKKIFITFLMF